MVSEPLRIEVKPRNDRGQHLVIASVNGTSHKHRFDVDNQRDRKAFREATISRFSLDDDAHEWLEQIIVSGAVTADSEGAIVECSTVRMSDVAPEEVEWLWRERFAIGKLTLLVGDPGQGKSFLTLDMAARISRGAVWPDNQWEPQQAGDVILLTAEDDLGDTIRPRLDALEADVSRIIAIKGAKFFDDTAERMVNLATDLQSIRKVIQSANQPRAIIIDPVSAYLGKTDSHKNAEVRAVLSPLSDLAAELRVAVIAVSHLRKGEGAAMYRTMGSLAFIAAARSAWVVCKDETDQSRRLLLPLKSNIAPDVGGLAFSIQPHGMGGQPTLCWEREPVSTSADDTIGHGQHRKRGPAPDERTEAAEWLREQLSSGARPKGEIIDEGDGIGFSKRTLERAFREIGGKSRTSGFPAIATWSLSLANSLANDDTAGTPGEPGEPVATGTFPVIHTHISKFRSNTDAVTPGSQSVADLEEFEAERAAIAGEDQAPF